MKKLNLLWIVPLCLVIGWTIGFYLGIPKHITIDMGENAVKMSELANNISINYNGACHNLTFECTCDNSEDIKKRFSMIQAYMLEDWRNSCKDVNILTYACMNKRMFVDLDTTCESLTEIWGDSLT